MFIRAIALLLFLAPVGPRPTAHANRSRSESDAGRLIRSNGAGSLPGYAKKVRDVPAAMKWKYRRSKASHRTVPATTKLII